MDAGLVVLSPLDEIFDAIERQGFFLVTNYQLLDWEASLEACVGCGVQPEFRLNKLTLAGGLMGFRKEGTQLQVLNEALSAALLEKTIAATNRRHRHDQAVISLLMYRHFGRVPISDGVVYLGCESPRQVPGQKVWVHRGNIAKRDAEHFAEHITTSGRAHFPSDPRSKSLFRKGLRFLFGS
jgi:hypothetical protein